MRDIKNVVVLGANGTMGKNVAGIFASFGAARVYLVSRSLEKSREAMASAAHSVRAESIANRMVAADYGTLGECLQDADLVFEACAENWQVKSDIHSQVAEVFDETRANPVAICSGTSGLSITEISKLYPERLRDKVVGMHMFNPPYQMPLCELIPTTSTDPDLLEGLKGYASNKLLRTVVPVRDTPAFLGNRIGFHFINEALQRADRYRDSGGVDYVDAIFGPFSGRAMPPIVTADIVGLDVHKAIVDNVHDNTDDFSNVSFGLPGFVEGLIRDSRLGRKAGGGLYRTRVHADGARTREVWDVSHGGYRDLNRYVFPFATEMRALLREGDYEAAFRTLETNKSLEAEVCLAGLLRYVAYSLVVSTEIADGLASADDVMVTGFNWCPPGALVEALGGRDRVTGLCEERLDGDWLGSVDVRGLLEAAPATRYDYRRFVRAGR